MLRRSAKLHLIFFDVLRLLLSTLLWRHKSTVYEAATLVIAGCAKMLDAFTTLAVVTILQIASKSSRWADNEPAQRDFGDHEFAVGRFGKLAFRLWFGPIARLAE